MAIAELLTLRLRKKIAWFSDVLPIDAAAAFNERGFAVELCTDENIQDSKYLVGIAAVVFTQNANKPTAIALHLEKYGQKLLDYDCRIILRPSSKEIPPGSKQITTFTPIIADSVNNLRLPTASLPASEANKLNVWQPSGSGNPPLPHAHFFDEGVPWSHVANFIVEHPAGKAPDFSLKIFVDSESKEGLASTLSPCRELLIRRAFWDCKEVHLVPENDGQSGVMVYRAYADLAHGHIGPWPLPYFVKIGDRQKIFKEYDIYNKYVDPYVPFHLGPHLIHERCCLGSQEGVIVGDYVEESESLQNCARDGRAAQAIASLFNRTLHGWYRHTEEIYKPLTKCIRFPYFPFKRAKSRIERAHKLGAKKSPLELLKLFKLSAHALPVLVGPTHGDLHAKNVRVRATDAIVIDFLAYGSRPLVYDAAFLEASLLVDGFIEVKERDVEEWLKSIMPLYNHKNILDAPSHPHPKDKASWFYACVRQIRLYGKQMERHNGQYAAALAIALLRKSSKDLEVTEPEASRRAAAYVLAERVLMKTFGSEP